MQGRATFLTSFLQPGFLTAFKLNLLSPQQPAPYIPSPMSNLPVPHPCVSASAGPPPPKPVSTLNSFSLPLPPGPSLSIPPASVTHLQVSNMSTAPSATPSFSNTQTYPPNSGPAPASTFSCAPHMVPASLCTVSGPTHSSMSVAPSVVAPPVTSSNASADPPLRFTFDELNLPDLYASFKSLFKTMRERGGSQCEYSHCVFVCGCVLQLVL